MTGERVAVTGATMDRAVERKRMDPRLRWIAIAIGGILIALVAWWLIPAGGSTDIAAAEVETGTVQRAPFDDYLPVRATVAPRLTTYVSAISGGQVEKLMVQDGMMVAAGQPLATLANPSLKLDILSREAEIAGRLGDISGQDLTLERNRLDRANETATADYDLVKARRDLSIRQRLHDQGFVSDEGVKGYQEQAQYQQKRLGQLRSGEAHEDRIAGVQAARLADARSRLSGSMEAVRAGLDALVVRAPVGGRLTNFNVQPGQMLRAGEQAGQIDSEGAWKLVADVDEYYLGRVSIGQAASGDGNVALIVTKVLPAVSNGRFRVELGFKGQAPAALNRGQTMDIRITLGATRKALVAPVGGWLDAGAGSSAFVVDADGHHAHRRTIRTGARNPEQVEIASGLAAGDRIVTSNTASIKGDVLNIR
ncbi:MAG: HlyD family efflux transporter periplasmic adaptor subunit [Pseudomonadota bacterium]|nr:HlyD family efflux transporter periplasmic adaptor subunit [Pseudomonadota bacterium]